jgi:hypothetical protein
MQPDTPKGPGIILIPIEINENDIQTEGVAVDR